VKNKLKIILIICSIGVLGVASYIYFFGRKSNIVIGVPENNTIVGDVARYINSQSCDEYSQAVIEKININRDQIHSCKSTKVEGEDYYLVEIESGEAQDCPAGCFYESNVYKVSSDRKIIEEFLDGIETEE